MRRFLNNRISNYNNVGDKVDDFCEDCENRWLPFSRVWWDSTEKNIADIKRKDNGIFVIKKILSLINSISESIKDIYDRINAIEPPILSEKLIELENDYLEVGVTADDKQEDLNIAIYENYISLKNTKVDKPLIESTSDSLKIVALDNQGESVFIKSNELGKVKSVNNKIGDVILKTSDLENDSDYTTNLKLNQERDERISGDNLKLDKPTTSGTTTTHPNIVGVDDLGNSAKLKATDFGKVKSVNGKEGDVILKTSDLENNSDYTTNAILTAHTSNKSNPHNVTKEQIGLGNVDNTSDLNKPISTATQTELNKKLDKPTTNNTPDYVLLADGSTAPKSDFGKVKTINNQEPDAQGNIDLEKNEFVKNGVGWSLKYRADNPTFYGAMGQGAIDFSISKSVNTKMPERFSYGANGFNSAVFGISNSAMDAGSLVSGVQNRSQGQCNNIMSSNSTIIQDKGTGNFTKKDNGIYSGSNNTIENNRNSTVIGGGNNRMVGKISPVNNMYDMYNAIIGGNNNTLTNSISNIILGGTLNNIIGEEKSRENGSYNSNNAIIGGYKNKIITATGTNKQAYSSVIFGGEENIAQGFYNMVAGYGNHAVTVGEVLTGMYGTVQNTSLSGYDFISDSRMFNVGIGESTTQGVVTRKDGFSVFRHGLVTAPSLTTSLIENNSKAVTTKEFVDSKISNFKLPTNWESPQQKFSGLLDKSADATYNQLLGVDSNGNIAKVGLNAVTNAMSKSSDAQKDAFRLASRKSTEGYSIGVPRVDYILPNLIANNKDEITYVSVVGLNLLLNLQDCEFKLINFPKNKKILFS